MENYCSSHFWEDNDEMNLFLLFLSPVPVSQLALSKKKKNLTSKIIWQLDIFFVFDRLQWIVFQQ